VTVWNVDGHRLQLLGRSEALLLLLLCFESSWTVARAGVFTLLMYGRGGAQVVYASVQPTVCGKRLLQQLPVGFKCLIQ
jgi:hypothetical protein